MSEHLFAKGKRGLIYVSFRNGRKLAIKRKNPESAARGRIANEGAMLKLANNLGIGPQLVSGTDTEVVYEFVEGVPIVDFISSAGAEEISSVLRNVLEQCRALDMAGISKEEMTRPVKHILVTKSGPVMIDFERAHRTSKPHNVTQFVQFLTSEKITSLLRSRGVFINVREARIRAARYKKNPSQGAFLKILQLINVLSPFQTAVLLKTSEIPEGKVASYSDIAAAIGTKAVRAVGAALAKNPCSPEIPCHRVVRSDGSIGGYSGNRSKESLLREEGLRVVGGRLENFESVRHRFAKSSKSI